MLEDAVIDIDITVSPFSTFPNWFSRIGNKYLDEKVFFVQNSEDATGEWKGATFTELSKSVQSCARALHSLGLRKGMVVAFIAANCLEWDIVHYACLTIGAVVLGIDFHSPKEQQFAAIADSKARFLFTDKEERLADIDLKEILIEDVILLKEPTAAAKHLFKYHIFSALIEKLPEEVHFTVHAEDPAILVYTSGTTASPKGIVYTHRQLLLALDAMQEHYKEVKEYSADERTVACWMPLSNLFQRMLNMFALEHAFRIFYCPNPVNFINHLPHIRPSILVGVPRLFEKVANEAIRKIRFVPRFLRPIILKLFVGPMIKRIFGGKIKALASGSSKTPMHVLELFEGIGLPIYEIYGMSENIIPMAGNNKNRYRMGSVGIGFRYNKIRVAEDGEIFVNSPGIGSSCAKQSVTSLLESKSDYFATKDLGLIDPDGFLYVDGRKDNVIKTSTGVRILCDDLEKNLISIQDIEQAVLVGNGRKLLTAIVASKSAEDELARKIHEINEQLPSRYRLHGILIRDTPFSIASDLITSNLKLKRQKIEQFYAKDLDALYIDIEQSFNKQTVGCLPSVRKIL